MVPRPVRGAHSVMMKNTRAPEPDFASSCRRRRTTFPAGSYLRLTTPCQMAVLNVEGDPRNSAPRMATGQGQIYLICRCILTVESTPASQGEIYSCPSPVQNKRCSQVARPSRRAFRWMPISIWAVLDIKLSPSSMPRGTLTTPVLPASPRASGREVGPGRRLSGSIRAPKKHQRRTA